MTFTGAIGAACMYPLRAIIRLCVALRIHPNTLTLVGQFLRLQDFNDVPADFMRVGDSPTSAPSADARRMLNDTRRHPKTRR